MRYLIAFVLLYTALSFAAPYAMSHSYSNVEEYGKVAVIFEHDRFVVMYDTDDADKVAKDLERMGVNSWDIEPSFPMFEKHLHVKGWQSVSKYDFD